jgi:hypothetical protein
MPHFNGRLGAFNPVSQIFLKSSLAKAAAYSFTHDNMQE